MKRPAKKDKYILKPQLIEEYVDELEKYCDELEERKKRLDKALDKACEELEIIDYENKMCQNPLAYDCDHKDASQWKEWFLKDE